jgi:hypothetical protein
MRNLPQATAASPSSAFEYGLDRVLDALEGGCGSA